MSRNRLKPPCIPCTSVVVGATGGLASTTAQDHPQASDKTVKKCAAHREAEGPDWHSVRHRENPLRGMLYLAQRQS